MKTFYLMTLLLLNSVAWAASGASSDIQVMGRGSAPKAKTPVQTAVNTQAASKATPAKVVPQAPQTAQKSAPPKAAPQKATTVAQPVKDSRFTVQSELALSTITYRETFTATAFDYSSKALTGKISVKYALQPKRWDVGISSFFTLLPFSMTPAENKARFLGVNARLGYLSQSANGLWKYGLFGGMYYTTMMVSPSNSFGFTNLSGPQIYPVVSRMMTQDRQLNFYAKYSGVGSGMNGFTHFSSHEMAMGTQLQWLNGAGKNRGVSIDWSSLTISVPDQDNFKVSLKTLSLGYFFAL